MEDEKSERVQSMAEYLAAQKAPAGESGQSLAEFLGVLDPGKPPEEQNPVPPPKMTAKQLSRGILQSQTYRESILRRVLLDTLPPAVEIRFHDYAHGKPIERVELEDKTVRLDDAPSEKLEARLLKLLDRTRQLKREQATGLPPSDEGTGSIN